MAVSLHNFNVYFVSNTMKKQTHLLVILTASLFFLLPNLNFGQVPNLGTASDFLLFTTVGALGNTGVSQISGGAIGTNLGAITNFESVICPQHKQDNATAQCALDLQKAFNEIHNIPVTSTIPAELSGTFIPGVYRVNSAATLTTSVTLDAKNIPGAQFIFNVSGAFAAAANAQVLLINGASVNNIFWNVDGAVGAGAGASIKGTFLVLAGAIDFGDGSMLEGRALTIAGAVTINNTTIKRCLLPVVPATNLIQPTCSVSTGTITITAPIGAGITYSIDGVTFTNITGIFSQVPAGTYTVTAKNQDGCISTSEVTIVGFGHLPDLGTVTDFVLFTSVGAVGNTGVSFITGGSIGTNLGVITGFESVACDKHIKDAATAQCALDLQAAIAEINAITPTGTMTAASLSGDTITAGVYQINTAAAIATDLTLDAENNPDALFIFKVTGALSIAAAVDIILINGASVNNVFWIVDGAVSSGAGATMKGIFLLLAGEIVLGDGAILEGRALSIAGAANILKSKLSVCIKPSLPNVHLIQPNCVQSTGSITIISPTAVGMTYRIDYCEYSNTTGIFTQVPSGTYLVTAKDAEGCISEGTTVIIIDESTSITWTGTTSNEWNYPGNWNINEVPGAYSNAVIPVGAVIIQTSDTPAVCNNLTIKTGASLTLKAGKALTVNGCFVNNAGITGLIIESNTSGTGSLINNSAGVSASIEQYMNGLSWAWHFLSSPVTNQPISDSFTPSGTNNNFDFYTWFEPSLLWVNFKNTTAPPTWLDANGSTNFLPASGYLVAYEAISTMLDYSGLLNTGPVYFSLTKSGGNTYQYFNLVGNPYPCSIDWKAATGWERDKLDGTDKSFWIWNDASGNYGTYSTAIAGDAGTQGVTRNIAPAQGFFVEAGTIGQLTMDNGIKVHSSQAYLKDVAANNEELRLKLTCEANAYNDEAIISFNNSNSEGGSHKFSSMYASAPELWSVKNGKNYSINFLGKLNTDRIVPITIKAGTAGRYTLTASQVESFGSGDVRLEDRTKGIYSNLRVTPEYTFQVTEPSTISERFFLHYTNALSVNNIEPNKNFTINAVDGKIKITSTEQLGCKIKVTDMVGRTIAFKHIDAGETIYIDMHGNTGVYIVSGLVNNRISNTKIIVN